MRPTPATRRDHAFGAALCVLYVAALLYSAPDLGLSRDEGMYVVAAQSYASWISLLAHDPGAALQPLAIDRHFAVNHEHPPLWKLLFALSSMLDQKLSLFSRESLAYRFPGMLSAGLLLWLIYVFGTRCYGRRAGAFAAFAFALMPRVFYHAHLDAFDVPITLMVTAVTYAYYRSLRERRWALWCGVLFGLALASKHNSWLLPGIYAIHFALVTLLQRRRRALGAEAQGVRVSAAPYWLLAMVLLGPPIFIGSWPWLWHHTLERIGDYAAFHLHHEYYNMEYFGVNYFWPPFPFSFPWVMTLYTVPVTTLLLGLAGMVAAGRRELQRILALLARGPRAAGGDDPLCTFSLLFGSVLAPLLVIALPSTPIFGGTKHWLTAYPFLALFAGHGFALALRAFQSGRSRMSQPLVALGAGALLLLPAAVETRHSHPFGLSHYGMAAGFVPGAADRGMNRQFWGFTTGSLVDFFYEHLPHGGRVYVCDTTETSFRMLARDGLLPHTIVPTRDIATADYAIVHHELHFLDVEVQIWSSYGTTRPVYVLAYDGVPIISVYENPRHARARGAAPR